MIRNYLIVVANQTHIIRFEPNPYLHKPFVYGNILEDPDTRRGISPLRVAKSLNDISSEILSKQVYCLDLIINPVWLSPAKMLDKNIKVKGGMVIEYKTDELNKTNMRPERVDFSGALTGFDFISYFKSLIERATGIFKNMVGAEEGNDRTATETKAVVAGQSTRQNRVTDKIYSNIIIPVIEKTADTIANESFGTESIYQFDKGNNKGEKIEITDESRNGNYRYIYTDSKSKTERITNYREVLAVIKDFMQDAEMRKKTDIVELFKMTMEQMDFDNVGRVILDDREQIEKNVNDMQKEKVIQDYAQATLNGGALGGAQGFDVNNGQMGMPQGVPAEAVNGFNQ